MAPTEFITSGTEGSQSLEQLVIQTMCTRSHYGLHMAVRCTTRCHITQNMSDHLSCMPYSSPMHVGMQSSVPEKRRKKTSEGRSALARPFRTLQSPGRLLSTVRVTRADTVQNNNMLHTCKSPIILVMSQV